MKNIDLIKKQAEIIVNLYNTNKFAEVIHKGKILIKKFPDQVIFYNATSLSLSALGKDDEALLIMKDALSNHPKNIHVLNNLGLISSKLNDNKLSREYYNQALSINNNFVESLINLGNLELSEMNLIECKSLYEKALSLSKNNQTKEIVYTALGYYYQQIGNFDEALNYLYKVNELNPNNTVADKSISLIHKYKDKNDIHLTSMKKKISLKLSEEQNQNLFFALGKAYEDLGLHKESFKFLSKANEIADNRYKYNINKDIDLFNQLKNLFQNFNSTLKIPSTKKFIFIVGMPRSGTTLIEQIVSAHRDVFGAGELKFLNDSIHKNILLDNKFINEKIEEISFEKLRKIQEEYLEGVKFFNYNEKFLIDKAPLNFRWIGFIKILFPESKIIHCKRDPMDICFSNLKNSFAHSSLSFSYNQEKLGNFFNLYKSLMEYWKSKFRNEIFDLVYEDLLNNQKKLTKELLNFCDLSWDENCMKPHKNNNKVATASLAQVRAPIYKSSIKKWENYSEELSILKNII